MALHSPSISPSLLSNCGLIIISAPVESAIYFEGVKWFRWSWNGPFAMFGVHLLFMGGHPAIHRKASPAASVFGCALPRPTSGHAWLQPCVFLDTKSMPLGVFYVYYIPLYVLFGCVPQCVSYCPYCFWGSCRCRLCGPPRCPNHWADSRLVFCISLLVTLSESRVSFRSVIVYYNVYEIKYFALSVHISSLIAAGNGNRPLSTISSLYNCMARSGAQRPDWETKMAGVWFI